LQAQTTGRTTKAGVPEKNFDTQRIPSLQPLVGELRCDHVATKSTKNPFYPPNTLWDRPTTPCRAETNEQATVGDCSYKR
ncbi:MAG TPA: hypothetical protein VFJ16_18185, partial [Longimicrobium sp.]|nr:hypothetical protein [Longimicrobium sp.]